MHEIICPHCQKAFKIDEAGYAEILKQVRDSEFDEQLHERLLLAEQEKLTAISSNDVFTNSSSTLLGGSTKLTAKATMCLKADSWAWTTLLLSTAA
jgi:hypothetical protein